MDKEQNSRPAYHDRGWQEAGSRTYDIKTEITKELDLIRIPEGFLYTFTVRVGATPTAAMVFVPAIHAPQNDMEVIHG